MLLREQETIQNQNLSEITLRNKKSHFKFCLLHTRPKSSETIQHMSCDNVQTARHFQHYIEESKRTEKIQT